MYNDVTFTKSSLFRLQLAGNQNHGMQEGKGFLHALVFFIEWNGSAMILTSASLVRDSGDENKIVDNLSVGVH